MALPTDANVELMICDAARATPDGKLDLAGLFPIPAIRVDPAAQLPAGLNLTLVYVLKDGEGQFRCALRIVDPLGKELLRQPLTEVGKAAGQHHIMIMPIALIPIALSGEYAIVLEIEGQEYRRTVRIFQ